MIEFVDTHLTHLSLVNQGKTKESSQYHPNGHVLNPKYFLNIGNDLQRQDK